MKVLGMSDALTSPISSLRLPRAGFLASAKTNPFPPSLWFSNRSSVAVLLADGLVFPSPVLFFLLLFKRIHLSCLFFAIRSNR